jgi:glutamate synthase domain-containing protein 3
MKIDGSKVEDVPADEVIRGSLGSGIHGGTIYIRGKVPERLLGVSATAQPFTQEDDITLRPILEEFCRHFDVDMERIYEREIAKIGPSSSRPFSAYYNARPV